MTQVKSKVQFGESGSNTGRGERFEGAQESALGYLDRHASGDWGNGAPEDWEENEFSLKNEFRLLSASTSASVSSLKDSNDTASIADDEFAC